MKRFNFAKMQSFVWRAALTMLFFVMITSHFTFGFAAKYTSGASDSDSARVAKFDFTLTANGLINEETITIADFHPGSKQEYTITLKNDSEVALRCRIKAVNQTNNLPLTMSLNQENCDVAVGETKEFTFTIGWAADKDDPDYMSKVDYITLTVYVEQID